MPPILTLPYLNQPPVCISMVPGSELPVSATTASWDRQGSLQPGSQTSCCEPLAHICFAPMPAQPRVFKLPVCVPLFSLAPTRRLLERAAMLSLSPLCFRISNFHVYNSCRHLPVSFVPESSRPHRCCSSHHGPPRMGQEFPCSPALTPSLEFLPRCSPLVDQEPARNSRVRLRDVP